MADRQISTLWHPGGNMNSTVRGSRVDPLGGKIFLVIDDEESVLEVVKYFLELEGFSVITASDGHEGLARFRENAAGIGGVFLDLSMPDLDGEEVFQDIRKLNCDVPILVATGHTKGHVEEQFKGQKNTEFLQKPFRMEELMEKIESRFKSPAG
jgi:DNA-binding response OmpR family regulator